MSSVTLPLLLYGLLHLAGYHYPVRLWGVDQLHYYPLWVAGLFCLLAAVGAYASARPQSLLPLERALGERLRPRAAHPILFQLGGGLLFVGLAWPGSSATPATSWATAPCGFATWNSPWNQTRRLPG